MSCVGNEEKLKAEIEASAPITLQFEDEDGQHDLYIPNGCSITYLIFKNENAVKKNKSDSEKSSPDKKCVCYNILTKDQHDALKDIILQGECNTAVKIDQALNEFKKLNRVFLS